MVSREVISKAIRFGVAMLVLISISLILAAPGPKVCNAIACVTLSDSNFKLDVSNWDEAVGKETRIWGQIALIILSVAFALFPLIQAFTRPTATFEIGTCVLSAFVMIICGGVEIWYATGFGLFKDAEVTINVQGWSAAAAFFFLSAILYGIDAFLVYRNKKQ